MPGTAVKYACPPLAALKGKVLFHHFNVRPSMWKIKKKKKNHIIIYATHIII
jgi:hypothetical protein